MSRQMMQLQKGLLDWWEGRLRWKVVLRSISLDSGALCVMNAGIMLMLLFYAVSWATQEHLKLPGRLSLELAVDPPGIPVCGVQEQSRT